jgi:transforming growth factor-beta-induced protein
MPAHRGRACAIRRSERARGSIPSLPRRDVIPDDVASPHSSSARLTSSRAPSPTPRPAVAAAAALSVTSAATIYELAASLPSKFHPRPTIPPPPPLTPPHLFPPLPTALSTLKSLVDTASLATTLNSSAINATVFAPTNDVFTALNANILDYVTNPRTQNVAALTTVLLYHVNTTVPVLVLPASFPANTDVTLYTNDAPYFVTVRKDGNNAVTINGPAATILAADQQASNGVVHVINGLLVPGNFPLPTSDIPTLAGTVPTFSSLVASLTSAGLVSALTYPAGPFTVFAPNDAAFAKLLPNQYQANNLVNVLKAHVYGVKRVYSTQLTSPLATLNTAVNLVITTEGSDVYVNGISKVIAVDTDAQNGVIHTIDTVIGTLSIYDLAVDASLTTLVQLVNAANLRSVLDDLTTLNAYTVFAPTNAAFAALGTNTLSWVQATRNVASLTKILTYHVAAPAVWSRQLTDGMKVTSVEGQNLTITTTGGAKVNGANIVTADVNAYNGAVHVIDGVLVPSDVVLPAVDILNTATGAVNLTSLVAALTAANLASVFAAPGGPYTVFAPINAAFAAANSKATDTNDKLVDVLKYHVVEGRYYSDDLSHLSSLVTLEGKNVTVDLYSGSTVQIKSIGGVTANVIVADIDCSNGVVHFIDAVLLPERIDPTSGATTVTAQGAMTFTAVAAGVIAAVAGMV